MVNRIAIAAGVVLVAGLAGAGAWAASFANEQTRTCTVTDTDRTTRVVDGQSSSDMRIYTEDCGTLAVGDVLLRGQFDSADIFGQLEPGETYEVTTIGWRVPFLSQFPTVLGDPVRVGS